MIEGVTVKRGVNPAKMVTPAHNAVDSATKRPQPLPWKPSLSRNFPVVRPNVADQVGCQASLAAVLFEALSILSRCSHAAHDCLTVFSNASG